MARRRCRAVHVARMAQAEKANDLSNEVRSKVETIEDHLERLRAETISLQKQIEQNRMKEERLIAGGQ